MNLNSGLEKLSYGQMPLAPKMTNLLGHISVQEQVGGASFTQTLGALLGKANETIGKPNDLGFQAVRTGKVDIHEVMIANAKADITVNIASQVVTKVIQAYERVQQIQV